MSLTDFERMVLARPGAPERVAEFERQILMAHALRQARTKSRVSQRELAKRMGVSQPRIAAIERADDLTLSTFARYVTALGGTPHLEIELNGERLPVL